MSAWRTRHEIRQVEGKAEHPAVGRVGDLASVYLIDVDVEIVRINGVRIDAVAVFASADDETVLLIFG